MQFKGIVKTIAKEECNEIVCSSLTQYESMRRSTGYAIKFVSIGEERYSVDGKSFEVRAGDYLLLNKGRQFECNFQSADEVKGCCITLDERLISEVYHVLIHSDAQLLDNTGITHAFPGLHEQVYSSNSPLGIQLYNLHRQVSNEECSYYYAELFYAIAVALLKEQAGIREKIFRIGAAKLSTRVELFSRMEAGRQFLEAYADADIGIRDAAQQATLSEFHFCRIFKDAYGISPHQFLLKQRSERAALLIAEGHENLTELATSCGFKDVFSLSRSFRKIMGMTATSWRAVNFEKIKAK
jgi:AraC family transcriptional regulator